MSAWIRSRSWAAATCIARAISASSAETWICRRSALAAVPAASCASPPGDGSTGSGWSGASAAPDGPSDSSCGWEYIRATSKGGRTYCTHVNEAIKSGGFRCHLEPLARSEASGRRRARSRRWASPSAFGAGAASVRAVRRRAAALRPLAFERGGVATSAQVRSGGSGFRRVRRCAATVSRSASSAIGSSASAGRSSEIATPTSGWSSAAAADKAASVMLGVQPIRLFGVRTWAQISVRPTTSTSSPPSSSCTSRPRTSSGRSRSGTPSYRTRRRSARSSPGVTKVIGARAGTIATAAVGPVAVVRSVLNWAAATDGSSQRGRLRSRPDSVATAGCGPCGGLCDVRRLPRRKPASSKDDKTERGDERETEGQPDGDRRDRVHPRRQTACRAAHEPERSCRVARTPTRAGAGAKAASTVPSVQSLVLDGLQLR